MAQLYFNQQLIATAEAPGVLWSKLLQSTFNLKYKYQSGKCYTVIMYDDISIHFLKINIRHDCVKKSGDVLVEYTPFIDQRYNYNGIVNIYEQSNYIEVPEDDFDMERFINVNSLTLIYTIEFTILQKLHTYA